MAETNPLQDLAASLLAGDDLPEFNLPQQAAGGTDLEAPTGFSLELGDVLGDGNGEVVFHNEAGVQQINVATDALIVAQGTTAHHVTEGGEDVSGHAYVTFDTGVTLYYPLGLDLNLEQPT